MVAVGQAEGGVDQPGTATPLLALEAVDFAYGRKAVLHQVDLDVRTNEIAALVGHNGAGKTTLMRLAAGLLKGHKGSVKVDGQEIGSPNPLTMSGLGVAYVEPQGVFPNLSVRDNLRLSYATAKRREGTFDDASALALELFPDLRDRRKSKAGSLSGGQRQMLAIAGALVRRPRILLLDEPLLGLAPTTAKSVMAAVTEVRMSQNMAILLVEQNVDAALRVSSRTYVLRAGEMVESGLSEQFLARADFWSLI